MKIRDHGINDPELKTGINKDINPSCRMDRYINLHKEFDPDEGEMTRSRKLRRQVLTEHYRALINAIYGNKTTVPMQAHVTYGDGREGTVKTLLHIKSVAKATPLLRPQRKAAKKTRIVKKTARRPKTVKKATKQQITKASKKAPKKSTRRRFT